MSQARNASRSDSCSAVVCRSIGRSMAQSPRRLTPMSGRNRRLRRRGLRPLDRSAGAARRRGHAARSDGRTRRAPGAGRDRGRSWERCRAPVSGNGGRGGRGDDPNRAHRAGRAARLRRRSVVRDGGPGMACHRGARRRGRAGTGHGGGGRALRGDRAPPGGRTLPPLHPGARGAQWRRGAGGRGDQGLARGARAGRGGRLCRLCAGDGRGHRHPVGFGRARAPER